MTVLHLVYDGDDCWLDSEQCRIIGRDERLHWDCEGVLYSWLLLVDGRQWLEVCCGLDVEDIVTGGYPEYPTGTVRTRTPYEAVQWCLEHGVNTIPVELAEEWASRNLLSRLRDLTTDLEQECLGEAAPAGAAEWRTESCREDRPCPVELLEDGTVRILGHKMAITTAQREALALLVTAYPQRRILSGKERNGPGDPGSAIRDLLSVLPHHLKPVLDRPSPVKGRTRGTGKKGWALVWPPPGTRN